MSNGAHALIVAFEGDPPPGLANALDLRRPIITEPFQVCRVGRPAGEVAEELAAAAIDGAALGAALIAEAALPENAWMAFEWRGALVVDAELDVDLGPLQPHWYEKQGEGHARVRVFEPQPPPCEPRGMRAPEIVGSPREFRSALVDERPVAIEASPDALLAGAAEWFGEFADPRLGGATALMTLSGASADGQPFLLRNPAALGLEVTDGPAQAARASAAGLVDLRGWGFGWGSLDLRALPTRASRDLLDAAFAAHPASAAGFGVLLEIEARVDPEIELEDGTVLEQESLTGVQTLAVAERRSVNVDAGQLRPLVAPAWCLDRHLRPPGGQPVRPTPLKLARLNGSQREVWTERESWIGS